MVIAVRWIRPTDRSGSHELSHLSLSSFVVCLWSQKRNLDISPNTVALAFMETLFELVFAIQRSLLIQPTPLRIDFMVLYSYLILV